jgi:hypothetical protein
MNSGIVKSFDPTEHRQSNVRPDNISRTLMYRMARALMDESPATCISTRDYDQTQNSSHDTTFQWILSMDTLNDGLTSIAISRQCPREGTQQSVRQTFDPHTIIPQTPCVHEALRVPNILRMLEVLCPLCILVEPRVPSVLYFPRFPRVQRVSRFLRTPRIPASLIVLAFHVFLGFWMF